MWALQVALRSDLAADELRRVASAWDAKLKRVEGLVQKYAVVEPTTGEFGLLLFFQARMHVEAFLASDVRKGLAADFEAREAPKTRRFEVLE